LPNDAEEAILYSMNWSRGLFRIWLLSSLLWLAVISYWASSVFLVPRPFAGSYQYSWPLKEKPWDTDFSKPFYEIAYPPGKGEFPDSFDPVEDEYIQQWDADVKAGKMVTIDFPDGASLYLSSQLTKDDQRLLSQEFWSDRWHRYASKLLPWLKLAFGPPIALFLAGLATRWIGRGFRKVVPGDTARR
jgi:hypothetical protein